MEKPRTIVEAIKVVLKKESAGLTSQEIYKRIVDCELYEFGAKTPEAAVHAKLRTHCEGLEFPTASPTKYFYIKHREGKTNYYALLPDDKRKFPSKAFLNEQPELDEMIAEEKMAYFYEKYVAELNEKLIEKIMACSPGFFERLVVNLLLKMGYGHDLESGKVVGRSHDGGIDGIISEDSLGLDQIYIQAKRYAKGKNVGVQEVTSFAGAMQDIQKGVFITTAGFTREAYKYVDAQQQKRIRLIDRNELSKLIIEHEVGLEIVQDYKVYRIDDNYFSDEF